MNTLKFLPVIFLSFISVTSCEDMWHHCSDGNGHMSADTRNLAAFTQVQVNGDFKVQVDTNNPPAAIVETDENLQDEILTHVSGNKLIIETRNGDCLNPSHPIEIRVSVPSVNNIEMNGSGHVYCYGLKSEDVILKVSGSGEIDLSRMDARSARVELDGSGNIDCVGDVENLYSQIEGSGEIKISGSAMNSELRVIGSGHLRAGELNTDVCTAYISGSGTIDTDVNNSLDVTIIGSGVVNYFGNPAITSYISGSGKIVKR